jgi:arylsulfatase A-like enzyme
LCLRILGNFRRIGEVTHHMRLLPLVLLALLGAAQDVKRPNFVLLMTDDQRWDTFSLAGNKLIQTPHMDRIGRDGIVFKNAFVTNALCAPSRATFLTGTYSHVNGVIDNRNRPIDPKAPWLPDLLRAAGYDVAFYGKSHTKNALRDRTWDSYFGYQGQGRYHKPLIAEDVDGKDVPHEGWMDDVVTDRAVDWLKKRGDKPFCLFLFFKAPHRSWERPARHADLMKDVDPPKPPTYADPAADKPAAFRDADNRIGNAKDILDYAKFIKDYHAVIKGVDDNVGKVFQALEDAKKLDDTALLFTGDNGFFLGEWGRYDKRFMHEVSIRVPLLIRYPKLVKAGSTSDKMAINVDWAPTVLDLAGVDIPKAMHGRSLKPLLKGEAVDWRKDWYYHYYEYPDSHKVKPHRGVRTETAKLIHYYEEPEEFELYDLAKDPEERKNVWKDDAYAALRVELTGRLRELGKELLDSTR